MLLKMVLTQIFVSEIHVYCLFFFNILHKLYISHLEPGLKNRKKKKKKTLFLLNNKLGFFLKRCGIFGAQSKRAGYDEPRGLEMQFEKL